MGGRTKGHIVLCHNKVDQNQLKVSIQYGPKTIFTRVLLPIKNPNISHLVVHVPKKVILELMV
ncbi:hypothetical protein [Lactiplantibacillus pentosus]|uniref:hypothetical protein n=1 Tax=Lactiplantibacillus pentosus TaxID=1589 RepID=UPI0013C45EDA|nr:hypothetical protein [Lactiplantibacillus pentosus]